VTLNDPVYLEAAHQLAIDMKKAENIESAITRGYEKAVFRELSPDKKQALSELYEESLATFKMDAKAMDDFLGTDDAELAALTVVANAIMNLDEFITKS
jgi:hypothetical protein